MPIRSAAILISCGAVVDVVRRREWLIVLALTLVAVGRVIATYHVFSETADEPTHVAAGLDWWRSDRYEFDTEHPPLARVFFALEPYLTGATMRYDPDRATTGNTVLYRNDRYHTNLEHVRAGNLPFLVIALLAVWLFARIVFDRTTSLAALALFGAMPPVLAHAGLATTDMAVTAFVIAATVAFTLWLANASWRNAAILAIAVATGLITKFSFPVFSGIAAAVMLVMQCRTFRAQWKIRAMQLLVVLSVAAVTIAAAYHFDTGTINDARIKAFQPVTAEAIAARYARVPGYSWVRHDLLGRFWDYSREAEKQGFRGADFVDWAKAAGFPSPLAGRHGKTMAGAPPIPRPPFADRIFEPFRAAWQWFATRVRVVAPQFFAGAELVGWHTRIGHPTFLLGRHSNRGWWYYFPVVFFFKTPLGFVFLALAGIVIGIRRGGAHAAVAFAPLLMFVPAMISSINIGIRHVLPVYPFLCIAAAVAVIAMWRSRRRVLRASLAVLLAWYFIAGAVSHPDYLAYFNEVAGRHPERIALDSNLDWGQDLLRLASIVSKRRITHLYASYFGSAEWKRHLPQADELPRSVPVDGWIAISEMRMQSGDFDWLRRYTPVQRTGKSIRLYYVTFR
jgi:4-amino-4-deoxy-L-arabinose transferase-like glycosyltransferase